MEKVKISVIVPCYNVEDRVRECLDSLISQSIGVENLELILVDDASIDGTVGILKEYEERFPEQVMIILCEENGRQGKARNIGMSYASGDWISFVDADDKIHHKSFEILMDVAEQTDADLITLKYSSDSSILETDLMLMEDSYRVFELLGEDERKKFVLREDLINNSCTQKVYRSDMIQRSGARYAEGVCYEEPLFTYPMRYFANRVAVTDLPLYFYHLNPNGTINQTMSNPSTILDHLSVQLQLLEFMRKQNFYQTYRHEIELNFLHCMVYEPYIFLTRRGYEVPESLLKKTRDLVNRLVPDWENNVFLNLIPEDEQVYIRRIAGK